MHKIIKINAALCGFLLFFGYGSLAQVPAHIDSERFLVPEDSQKLFVRICNKNFFKNNEYFSPFEAGLTLPGVIFEPAIAYRPGEKTSIEAGASFLKYFGRDGIYHIEPLFRFQYKPTPYLQVVMGSLHGGTRHGLIEPLFQWERAFTHPVENGLQFLFKTPKLNADVWLEWRKFIMKNDPFQEELLFGTTFSYNLLPPERSFNLSIPFQTTINHHGGQIDTAKVPMRTIANYASGLNASWQFEEQFLKRLDFEFWGIGYHDFSSEKIQEYKHGFGLYPYVKAFFSDFSIQAGYFYGKGYMNSLGEPLYFSAVINDSTGYAHTVRNMITCKIIYSKRISKGIRLAAYFELYKELSIPRPDYDYGIHIIFDRDFFVTRIK